MRPTVTDEVAWSVRLSVDDVRSGGLSVCHSREPCKTAEPIEMSFGVWSRVDPRNHALDWIHTTKRMGNFGGMAAYCEA